MIVATDVVVLHLQDYLESSRIVRFATRDAGIVSALARGARRPRNRFGAALDAFASGVAQLSIRSARDLQTLTGFDATRVRYALGADLARFTAANALAELAIRFIGEAPNPAAFDALVGGLDALTLATGQGVGDAALGAAWHLVAALGFALSVDACAVCDARVPPGVPAVMSHAAGGVLCARCGAAAPGGRPLPPQARSALRHWLDGDAATTSSLAEFAAHQRLLRLFLDTHLADGRRLGAFHVWEQARWARG